MNTAIAFLGLGAMGYPMAGHLARAGHRVTVYNRTATKAAAWVAEYGGGQAATPAEAAAGAEAVICCLGGDDDVRQIALGPDGALAAMAPGSLLIDHTTTSAALAREVAAATAAAAAATEQKIEFVDAPIAGGVKGARAGSLSIMAGGEAAAVERAGAIVAPYARGFEHMGPVGAGQLTKMVNQICASGIIQSLAEGLAFAQRAGLDDAKVIEVIAKGSAASFQIGNRAETMQVRDFSAGGTIALLGKDLAICLEEAERLGLELPILDLVKGFYAEIVCMRR
jgi:3-hydroxyisobutyrate dehydrogenase-like beta-hydroxyacid dehydrogenase